MTNIIYIDRFVEPYTIHSIAECIEVLDTSLRDCWGMDDKGSMLFAQMYVFYINMFPQNSVLVITFSWIRHWHCVYTYVDVHHTRKRFR